MVRFALCFLGTSGKRDSNSRPSAWEANALPTELFPLLVIRYSLLYVNNQLTNNE